MANWPNIITNRMAHVTNILRLGRVKTMGNYFYLAENAVAMFGYRIITRKRIDATRLVSVLMRHAFAN